MRDSSTHHGRHVERLLNRIVEAEHGIDLLPSSDGRNGRSFGGDGSSSSGVGEGRFRFVNGRSLDGTVSFEEVIRGGEVGRDEAG
jgi:hypothetical protein